LRELLNFEKALNNAWSIQVKELFLQALKLKKNLSQEDYVNPLPELSTLNRELDVLLEVDASSFHPKLQVLIKRLIKHRERIFLFLTHPDNSGGQQRFGTVDSKCESQNQSFRSVRQQRGQGG
jgi:hypothetical protein